MIVNTCHRCMMMKKVTGAAGEIFSYYLREAPGSSTYRILPPRASPAGNRFSGLILTVHESTLNLSHTTSASLRRKALQEKSLLGPRVRGTKFFTGKLKGKSHLFAMNKLAVMILFDQIYPSYQIGVRKPDT